jgi:hypothetical protein
VPAYERAFPVPSRPEDVISRVAAQIMQVQGYSIYQIAPATWLVQREYIPVVAIVFAVILFPIGLLLLLIKNRETVTVTCFRQENGAEVRATGFGSDAFIRLMDWVLAQEAYPQGQQSAPS